MICEQCGYQEKPDNMPRLMTHVQTCKNTQDPEKVKLVWRTGQITATLKSKKSEMHFPEKIQKLPSAPPPPQYVQRDYTPNVTQLPVTQEILDEIKRGQTSE